MKNVGLDLLRYNIGKLMKFIEYRFVANVNAADKKLTTELAKKQDKLTAGTNITITNNVISAAGYDDTDITKIAIYNAVASAVASLRTDNSFKFVNLKPSTNLSTLLTGEEGLKIEEYILDRFGSAVDYNDTIDNVVDAIYEEL